MRCCDLHLITEVEQRMYQRGSKTLITGFQENKLISIIRKSHIFNIAFLNSLKNVFLIIKRTENVIKSVYISKNILINLGAYIFGGWEAKLKASLLMLVCWCNKLPCTHKELQNNEGSYILTKHLMDSRNNG